jgi:ABC-type transport system substrate-binding protein
MSNKDLLREIQKDAVDGNSDLSTLLRKCVVLAARLDHKPLNNWAQWELNGYSEARDVPNYRTLQNVHSFGTFFGIAGARIDNAPLSLLALPEGSREHFANPEIRESVKAISEIIAANRDHGIMRWPWPPEACEVFDHRGYRDDLRLVQAWMTVPVASMAGILETVRNRVLDFALELEKLDLGHDETTPEATTKAVISQIFNQTIYGPVSNVGTAGDISQTMVVSHGDLEGLKARFREIGIPEPEVENLEKAIEGDKKAAQPKKGHFGKNVGKWLGELTSKAAMGLLKTAPDLIVTVGTQALKSFYGIQ